MDGLVNLHVGGWRNFPPNLFGGKWCPLENVHHKTSMPKELYAYMQENDAQEDVFYIHEILNEFDRGSSRNKNFNDIVISNYPWYREL